MSLNEILTSDLKQAMKDHDKVKLTVVRTLKSNLNNEKLSLGRDLTEDDEIAVVNREVKQHKDSIKEFTEGNREDLVTEEQTQLDVLMNYAPKQMSELEIQQIIDETINNLGASSMSDFGKVMGASMPKLKGKADGDVVKSLVKKALN
ncbi:GatB/YqeY domain-containing protein [Lactobacillus sp. S2-2]|uniref:GatB/YqeY domain-containing protein n=1 Tax=Lactobacillus sp. S2-2 TaxID=2692917 RepID=UPI001F28B7BB|nr:GatB/YqeY domain-containing protein [Lactobacillus sp. S2-2]MCF6514982.1 GatB/YqeY domain-containing protein [Lactobacillus sp. S2-2]